MNDRDFYVALLDNQYAPCEYSAMTQASVTWDEFVAHITKSTRTTIDKKHFPAFIPGRFPADDEFNIVTKRLKDMICVSMIVLDVDHCPEHIFRKLNGKLNSGWSLLPYTYLLVNSVSHLKDDSDGTSEARFRIIVPLDRDVTVQEHKVLASHVFDHAQGRLGVEIDSASLNANQQYRYQYRHGQKFHFSDDKDIFLNVGAIFDRYTENTEHFQYESPPTSNKESPIGNTRTDDDEIATVIKWLRTIPAASLQHDERFKILCALRGAGINADVAAHWYHKERAEFDVQWKSIHKAGVPLSYIKTLYRKRRIA